MAQYAIEDTTMTALADSVRGIVGETRLKEQMVSHGFVKISKTTNATGFDTYSGNYGNNQAIYEVITIPGASKIVVDMAYQSESFSYDYVQVASGSLTSMPSSATKYGGKTLDRTQLTFNNTDTITFYFRSDASNSSYLGYYAECRGYDADDNLVEIMMPEFVPVYNEMTIGEMISNLSDVEINLDNSLLFDSGTLTTQKYITIPLNQIMPNPEQQTFYIFTYPYFGSSRSSFNLFYNGKTGESQEMRFGWQSSSASTKLASTSFTDGVLRINFANTSVNNNYGSGKQCSVMWIGPKMPSQEG